MFSAVLLNVALAMAAPAANAAVPSVAPPSSTLLPTPQFRRYATSDGLPSSSVYTVVQDSDGAMWFGTKGGIARYDGVDFKVFRHIANDPGSLHDNGIASMLFDRDGRLWAGGLEAGLNRYDEATGKFVHWEHDPHDPSSLGSDKVWAIAQDADGSLLVGTARGLDRLLPDGRRFQHLANPLLGTDPATFGLVGALYMDSRRQLWIGSSYGVFRRDVEGRMHRVSQSGTSEPIETWHIDGNGDEVRIATSQGLLVAGKDDIARPFGVGVIPQGNVLSSVRDRTGRLWVGTQQGLFMQRRPGDPVMAVTDQPLLQGDLPGTWVWSMLVDGEGGLWVGLLDGGVAYLAPGWNDTSRFTHIPDDPASLRDSIVTAMARGHDDRVWVGERSGRIDKLDPVTGKIEHVLSGLGGDVLGMTQDAHERLWIAVRGGLYRYTLGKPPQRVDPRNQWLKHPLEVEPGPDGKMYARTFGEGLFQIDRETLAISQVPMEQANQRVLWGSQLTLHDGQFWYASDGGMLRMNKQHDRFEAVSGVINDRAVNAFDFTPDGLWMLRPDGLEQYRYRGDGLVLDRTLNAAHGWPSINVVDVRVDALQRVWLLGRDGLWCFDPASGRFRSLGLQNGLANGEFSRGFALMPDGNLYAPTLGGVVAFNPDRLRERTGVSPLAITQVSVRRDGKLQPLPGSRASIDLGWRERGFNVSARLSSYIDPAANHYRFRLRGFDADWVDAGNHGEREFAGLAAGDYTLEVKAAGADGQWALLRSPLRIHVQAPPWVRWWAWLIYALLLASAVSLVLRSWRRRLAQRHRMQLTEQQRQMAEAASAAKTQFLATLSHEIRTPMTGVMGMAELLLSTPLSPLQHDYTQAMQRSGSMLLKLLNDA
ncbi:two-component regulator propeller domain-containing protein, partial [Rhodanobacter umsongensis]